MKIDMRPIDALTPYASNPRKISQVAIDKVAASLKEFGFRQPIVVDERGVIIVGHTRHLAARKIGLTEVPVHVATGLTAKQIAAYRIADNRVGEEAEWDMELLRLEMAELGGMFTGFDVGEVELEHDGLGAGEDPSQAVMPSVFEIVVTCENESAQQDLYDKLTQQGFTCRVLSI